MTSQRTSASSSATCTDTALPSDSRPQDHFSVPKLMDLGHDASDRHDFNLAATYFQAAVSALRDQHEVTNDVADGVTSSSSFPSVIEYELAVASSHLGRCYMELGLTEDAVNQYQQELRFKRLYYNFIADGTDDVSAASNEENSTEGSKELRNVNLDLALSIERVAAALVLVRDYKTAKRHYHEALDMKRLVYGKEQRKSLLSPNETQSSLPEAPSVPNDSSIRSLESFKPTAYGYDLIQNTDIAYTHVQLGIICQYLHQFHKARNYYTAALSMYRTIYSEPNEYNLASANKFENRVHGDKRETFDMIEVKTLRPQPSKQTFIDTSLTSTHKVNHIDIAKVLAQLGLVNAILKKTNYASQYFDEASTMVRQLLADCNEELRENVMLYQTTLEIIQKEHDRCLSRNRDSSEDNHHPITWSQTI